MAIEQRKITDAQILQHGVCAAPDKLEQSTTENKSVFDRLVKNVVQGAHNSLIDDLTATGGATNIGVAGGGNVQGNLDLLQSNKADKADTFTKNQTISQIDQKVVEIGTGDMAQAVYDPNHRKQDIFSTFSNQNLLVNGDFQVWQRGFDFPNITSTIFTADRWIGASGSGSGLFISKVDKGLKMIKTFSGTWVLMLQRFESLPKQFPLTVSASIDNVVISLTMNAVSPVITAPFAGGYIEAGIGSGGGNTFNVTVVLTEQKEITVNWVKAEYGNVATPFVSRSYNEELALCQRYFTKLPYSHLETIGNACYGTTWLNLQLALPVAMRIVIPTVSVACQPTRVIDSLQLPELGNVRCRGCNANLGYILNGVAGSSYIFAGKEGYIELDAEIY